MHCMNFVALFVLAVVHPLDAAVVSRNKISPTLEPKSDKVFFKHDYPADHMPRAGKHFVFDHPYPAVQDTSDFDRDFVKDENTDGGRWKAQMDYDVLRTKIREAEKRVAEAKAELDKKDEEWLQVSHEYNSAATAEEDSNRALKKTEKEAAEADAKVEHLEGRASAHGDTKAGGAVGDAVGNVQKEMTDLDECKKKLAETKKKLKEAIKEKEDLEQKKKDAKEDTEKRAKKEADEAAKKEMEEKQNDNDVTKVRTNEKDKAEKEVEARTQTESSWRKKVAQEEEDRTQAVKSYEQELADVKKTEAELNKAAENLRKYRRPPHVDDDGGVYYKKESSAKLCSEPLLLFLAIMAATAFL